MQKQFHGRPATVGMKQARILNVFLSLWFPTTDGLDNTREHKSHIMQHSHAMRALATELDTLSISSAEIGLPRRTDSIFALRKTPKYDNNEIA